MKHLTILIPDGENNLSSIVGSYKLFSRANAYSREQGRKEVFKIELAGLSDSVEFYGGLFVAKPHRPVSEISKTDLIIIPSLNHHYEQAIRKNVQLVSWIRDRYKAGTEVASICTGAFLLAASGILDGKSCSTHWLAAENFRLKFPEVDVQPDRLITDEQGIYTNGGAYSFLNLLLYLIEKYYDRETALFLSKVFQIEWDRQSQSPFAIFMGQKHHGDELIHKAQVYMENRSQEKLSVNDLCTQLAVGRRTFDRRFTKATGNTPIEYVQRVKMEVAKRALESSRKTVGEIMLEVGYSDDKAFRDVFRRITGISPWDYQQKYGRDAGVS